jgi:hypothetical protein
MARPRVPLIKAQITGRTKHDPQRFKDRTEPVVNSPLGAPPQWMTIDQKEAWNTFRTELSWLNKSHRSLVEIASTIRARVMSGADIGVKALSLLRQCLGQMGATPTDSSKVTMPDDNKPGDPADKYFT